MTIFDDAKCQEKPNVNMYTFLAFISASKDERSAFSVGKFHCVSMEYSYPLRQHSWSCLRTSRITDAKRARPCGLVRH